MKDLSKKINKKIDRLESGKLGIEDLEELVDDAKELYERLIIVKYKAYEKYGEPEAGSEEIEDAVEEVVEATEKEEKVEEPTMEESAFDFSGISETEKVEQPSFDFSISEEETSEETEDVVEESTEIEEEESFPKADDFTVNSHEEEEENEEVFPKADDVKTNTSDIFKDSHVERHEPEDTNSLNEKLKTEEDELSLRKQLQSTPVTDLKSEISIAKKFEYITFMFEGKNEIYEEAIEKLNSCADGEEAKDKLNEYSTKYNWDLENKSIMKFVELVERRYL